MTSDRRQRPGRPLQHAPEWSRAGDSRQFIAAPSPPSAAARVSRPLRAGACSAAVPAGTIDAMRVLYHLTLSPYSRKVRLVLAEKNLDFTLKLEKAWERRGALLTPPPPPRAARRTVPGRPPRGRPPP